MSSDTPDVSASEAPKRDKARGFLKCLIGLYLFLLLAALVTIKTVGERYWICSLFLFLPPTGWLLPLAILYPASCWLERPWRRVLLISVFLVLFYYMDFHWSFRRHSSTPPLKVLTNNIGQRKLRTLTPFLEQEDPDIAAFQEGWLQGRTISKQNPNRYVATRGEFILVSKYEIKNSGFVPGTYSAAWFEVYYQGQSVIVYNVHMPTPRFDFERLRGKGFLVEAARGGGIYSARNRATYQDAMASRVRIAKELMEKIRQEKRPFLVLGDFNAPSPGYVHDIFASNLTDVFAAKGCGYGLTFPGFTLDPLSLFGPWLRIDYIFAEKNFRPLSCRVEPRKNAQHLAVSAEFEFPVAK